MLRRGPYKDRLQRLWQAAIEPHPELIDPERRHRVRLLNGVLVIFVPLAVVIVLVQLLVSSDPNQSRTINAIIMGIGVALLIYLFNHSRHYRLARFFTVFIGFIAVIVNAISSSAPHIEIAYLILLPLLGSLLLTLIETIVVSLLTLVGLVAFALMMGDIPVDIFKDLITFMAFVEVFIVFLSQQRNRLEADRQKLAVEQGRNALLEQLITNLSHDFRTPLTVIITNVYLLSRVKDITHHQEKLDEIQRQAMRINRLIDDILTMSSVDQRFDKSLSPMKPDDLLQTLYRQFRKQAEQTGIQLNMDIEENLEPLLTNFNNLRLILTNVVENALSYTRQGGKVTIRAFKQSNQLIIEITDSGIGISPQDLPSIFMPFFRADTARPTHLGGMGLGLAIAKRVVELQGGTISADSVLGQGSTFRVSLSYNPV